MQRVQFKDRWRKTMQRQPQFLHGSCKNVKSQPTNWEQNKRFFAYCTSLAQETNWILKQRWVKIICLQIGSNKGSQVPHNTNIWYSDFNQCLWRLLVNLTQMQLELTRWYWIIYVHKNDLDKMCKLLQHLLVNFVR